MDKRIKARITEIIGYIDSNLHRNVSLLELSTLIPLTPRYFCSVFKQIVGRPPHQYLIEKRVERACTLLEDPRQSLVKVALTVGFNSQSHMTIHFHRIVGVTPARYRTEVQLNRGAASRVRWRPSQFAAIPSLAIDRNSVEHRGELSRTVTQ